MSRAKKARQEKVSWQKALDAAVMQHFPEVTCETFLNIFALQHVTHWWQAGTDDKKLKPELARQVKAFVAGYMAAHENGEGA